MTLVASCSMSFFNSLQSSLARQACSFSALVDACRNFGVEVTTGLDLSRMGVVSTVEADKSGYRSIWINPSLVRNESSKRVVLAFELGRMVGSYFNLYIQDGPCAVDPMNTEWPDHEYDAFCFAAELLAPSRQIRSLLETMRFAHRGESVQHLAYSFNVSESLIQFHLKELGI